MKHLPFALSMLALAAAIAAVWRSDYAWQLGVTACMLIIAAAAIAGARQANQAKK